MAFATGHRAYTSSQGRGNGRYTHKWTCTCGVTGTGYGSAGAAQKAARQHEKKGK